MLNPPVNGNFKDFSRPLSVFQVFYNANLIFKYFSRQSCIFEYFSSMCEPCTLKYKQETQNSNLWVNVSTFYQPDCTGPCSTVSHMCLATDASLTADPGVLSSIPAWSNTFMEIDHEIISTVILLPSAESFKKGCCQLQAKVCAGSTG